LRRKIPDPVIVDTVKIKTFNVSNDRFVEIPAISYGSRDFNGTGIFFKMGFSLVVSAMLL